MVSRLIFASPSIGSAYWRISVRCKPASHSMPPPPPPPPPPPARGGSISGAPKTGWKWRGGRGGGGGGGLSPQPSPSQRPSPLPLPRFGFPGLVTTTRPSPLLSPLLAPLSPLPRPS